MVNLSVSKELDNYGYKFKMSFVIPVALQIHFFSKNKNVINHMQEANRTPLTFNDFPERVNKNIVSTMERRDLFSEPTAVAIFSFVSSVAASVFDSWLYEKIKNKPSTKIKINRKNVLIDKQEIIRVITEEIEIDQT